MTKKLTEQEKICKTHKEAGVTCKYCKELSGGIKTLKDLLKSNKADFSANEFQPLMKQAVAVEDLKQEAINDLKLIQLKIDWVEFRCEFNKRNRIPKPKEPEPDLPFESWGLMSLVTIRDYIKWKFNITEEDLKNDRRI